MSADFVVRFADFSGGDWGNRDPGRARPNQFKGTNVVVLDSELLSVRTGLVPLTISGLPTFGATDEPYAFEHWEDGLFLLLDDPYYIPIPADAGTSTSAASMGTLANGDATSKANVTQHSGNLYINVDGYLYKVLSTNKTTNSEITLPEPLEKIVRWNYYLVGVESATPWRLWFSDVGEAGADPDSWGANNFLDVGGNDPITALIPMYNYLYVGKKSGWYAVSGILADRPFVRQVSYGNGPPSQCRTAQTTDNRILYWATDNVPVWFNGDNPYLDRPWRVQGITTSYPAAVVAASPTGRRNIMLGESADAYAASTAQTELLLYDNGAWTTHSLPVKLGGVAGRDLRSAIDKPNDVMFFVNRPTDVADTVTVYAWDLDVDRPASDNDDWADPHDVGTELLDGIVELPAYYDPQSRNVLVRHVDVNFRVWPSDIADDLNELHLELRALGRLDSQKLKPQRRTWTQPADAADQFGSDRLHRFDVGDQGWATGFQVTFPRLRGAAIRSVEVHVEVRQRRG